MTTDRACKRFCGDCGAFYRKEGAIGECRRHAPKEHRRGDGHWPATFAGEWCWDSVPKPEDGAEAQAFQHAA